MANHLEQIVQTLLQRSLDEPSFELLQRYIEALPATPSEKPGHTGLLEYLQSLKVENHDTSLPASGSPFVAAVKIETGIPLSLSTGQTRFHRLFRGHHIPGRESGGVIPWGESYQPSGAPEGVANAVRMVNSADMTFADMARRLIGVGIADLTSLALALAFERKLLSFEQADELLREVAQDRSKYSWFFEVEGSSNFLLAADRQQVWVIRARFFLGNRWRVSFHPLDYGRVWKSPCCLVFRGE
jgi:hypothetical protein